MRSFINLLDICVMFALCLVNRSIPVLISTDSLLKQSDKQNSLKMYTDRHRYLIFTNMTNNTYVYPNSKSVLENPLASDLLISFGYKWVLILLEKEAWKDIESYLLFMCLYKFVPGKRFITISSNPH